MNIPFFSIIVPVYGVEEYLPKCVESLICQSYQNFEIILVDDGSPDACPRLCDDFAQRNQRVKVIHKDNGGLSSARNAGIDVAKGDYIIFVDGDDYWRMTDSLSALRERIEKYQEDLVLYRCVKQEGEVIEPCRTPYDLTVVDNGDKMHTLLHLCDSGNVPGAAWIMCVKKSLIDRLHLRFKQGITAEDYDWVMQLLYHANSIGAINDIIYVYVNRPNSITKSAKPSGVLGISYAIQRWIELGNRPDCLDVYLAKVFLLSLMNYSHLSTLERCELKGCVDRDSQILKIAGMKMFAIPYQLLGPYYLGRLVARLYSLRS